MKWLQDDKDVINDLYTYHKNQVKEYLFNQEDMETRDLKEISADMKHFRETYDENTGKYMSSFADWRSNYDKKQIKTSAPQPKPASAAKSVTVAKKDISLTAASSAEISEITIDDDDTDTSVNLGLPSASSGLLQLPSTLPRYISSSNSIKRPTQSPSEYTSPAKRARGRGRPRGRPRGTRGQH